MQSNNGKRRSALLRVAVLCAALIMAAAGSASAAPTESVLHSFTGGSSDGAFPFAGLIADSAGNLYGTTQGGGASNNGVVFKLAPGGTETVLHSFTGGSDGSNPLFAGLIADGAGNLYGTTEFGGGTGCGGPGCGVVFKLTPTGSSYTVLHSFAGGSGDGANPYAGLIIDSAGNLYGTTEFGGGPGCGVVFKLAPGGTETVLHTFTGSPNDGAFPTAGLFADSGGNLYGTTAGGGAPPPPNAPPCGGSGCGTVFKLAPGGAETVLYTFCRLFNCNDGAGPSGVIADSAGNL